jgi:hypothetical protein
MDGLKLTAADAEDAEDAQRKNNLKLEISDDEIPLRPLLIIDW